MGLGFIGVDWEVDWGVMDAKLSSIVPEVTGISHNFQKGVTECNMMVYYATSDASMFQILEISDSMFSSTHTTIPLQVISVR